MVVAGVCLTMKYPKRSRYKPPETEEVPRSQLGGMQPKVLRRRGDLTVWFDEEVHGVYPLWVLPPSSVATPCLNANVSWPACVGERH